MQTMRSGVDLAVDLAGRCYLFIYYIGGGCFSYYMTYHQFTPQS